MHTIVFFSNLVGRPKGYEMTSAKSGESGSKQLFVLLAIFLLVGSWLIYREWVAVSGSPSVASASMPTLRATVSFDGTQFAIANGDSEAWTDVKFEINGGLLSGGFEYRAPLFPAGEKATIGAMSFAKSDGTRFNPAQLKPQKFVITATLRSMGRTGIYVGGWP